MRSRIIVPSYLKRAVSETAQKAIVEESEAYKIRITNSMIAAVMLSANQTWNIGVKRMGNFLDNLTEWLFYFDDYMKDGVGFEILEKRLKEHGLYDMYKELILDEQSTQRRL